MEQGPLRTSALLGPEHTIYGDPAVETVSGETSIALTIGAHPKGYPSVDPNEDAVMAATTGGATLIAVCDGHNGFDAAEAAISAIIASAGDALDIELADPAHLLMDLARSADASIRRTLEDVGGVRRQSRTTLVMVLVHGSSAVALGYGDSSSLLVGRRRVKALTRPTPFLDGGGVPPAKPVHRSLRPGDVLVAASDGLIDFLGESAHRAVRDAVSAGDPAAMAVELVRRAGAGGAGDNVAVAVHAPALKGSEAR